MPARTKKYRAWFFRPYNSELAIVRSVWFMPSLLACLAVPLATSCSGPEATIKDQRQPGKSDPASIVSEVDEHGNPTFVKGYTENQELIKQDGVVRATDIPIEQAKTEKVFEFEAPTGYTPEYSPPIMVTGNLLTAAPRFDDCAPKTYAAHEPTVYDIWRSSLAGGICGAVTVNFCIRLTPEDPAKGVAYIKTPAINMRLLCPEEAFAGLSIRAETPTTEATSTRAVDLQITANPSVVDMYITNTPGCKMDGMWEPLAPIKSAWVLAGTASAATIYIALRDTVGHVSDCVSVAYTSAPADPVISINSGGAYSATTNVTLSLGPAGARDMYVTNTPACAGAEEGQWEAFAASKAWQLAATPGVHRVYVKYRNATDRESNCVSTSIIYDPNPPTATTLSINAGASHTANLSVTLTLAASDASEVYVTNTAGCASGGAWEAYVTTKNDWTLTGINASNTVYAIYRDATGNTSECVSASIIHDNQAPTSHTLSISAGATYATTPSVTLNPAATGASTMYITNTAGCGSGGTWEPYATSKASWSLAASNTNTSVYAKFRDEAGNETSCVNDAIVHDSLPPSTPTDFADGTSTSTPASSPLLVWTGSSDGGSGLDHYEVAFGSTPGGTDVAAWTSVGTQTSLAVAGLSLSLATTYYASVRAVDRAGLASSAANADGFTYRPWQQQAYIKAVNNNNNGDFFGFDIALSGETLAVGAYLEDSNVATITNGATASVDNTRTNAGAVYLYKRAATSWAQEAYVKAANSGLGDYFGYDVALDNNTLAVGAIQEDSNQASITNGTTADADNTNTESGAVYVYARAGTTWTEEAYIKAVNNDSSDRFGYSLGLDADTLAVGANREQSNQTTITNATTASADDSADMAGAVYVYHRNAAVWQQEAYIKAANSDGSDLFGSSLALSGDTLAVGAYLESSDQSTITNATTASSDNSAGESGAVYIYKRAASNWAQQAYVKAANAGVSEYFGSCVAVDGDTVVVGAYQEYGNQASITNGTTASSDKTASWSGAVYVYKRTGTTWAQEAYIKALNNDSGLLFGTSVSISDNTLAVGAYYENSNQTTITNGSGVSFDTSSSSPGAAYIYKRTATHWLQEAYIKAVNNGDYDGFGYSVALETDTLAVGAPWESSDQTTITNGSTAATNNNVTESGAVYLYTR